MLVAHLFFSGVEIKHVCLNTDYPPETIREHAIAPMSMMVPFDDSMMAEKAELKLWIYRLAYPPLGPHDFRYDFNYEATDAFFVKPEGRVFDIGSENAEPNEHVNLNILKNKMRDNLKTKKLLRQYYQR